jgi:hypothetical protein
MPSYTPLKRTKKRYVLSNDAGTGVIEPNKSQTLAISAIMKGKVGETDADIPLLHHVKGKGFDYMYWMSSGLFPHYFLCSRQSYLSESPTWREIIEMEGIAQDTIKNLNKGQFKAVHAR